MVSERRWSKASSGISTRKRFNNTGNLSSVYVLFRRRLFATVASQRSNVSLGSCPDGGIHQRVSLQLYSFLFPSSLYDECHLKLEHEVDRRAALYGNCSRRVLPERSTTFKLSFGNDRVRRCKDSYHGRIV